MGNIDGQWITWNGKHILIKNGQTKDEVVKQLAKKFIKDNSKKQTEDLVDKKNREIKEHEDEAKKLNNDRKVVFTRDDLRKEDYYSRDYEIMHSSADDLKKKRLAEMVEKAKKEEELQAQKRAERKAKDEERKKKLEGVDPKSRYKKSLASLDYEEWHKSYDKGVIISRAKMPLKDGGWKYVYKASWAHTDPNDPYKDSPISAVYGDTVQEVLDSAEKGKNAQRDRDKK